MLVAIVVLLSVSVFLQLVQIGGLGNINTSVKQSVAGKVFPGGRN